MRLAVIVLKLVPYITIKCSIAAMLEKKIPLWSLFRYILVFIPIVVDHLVLVSLSSSLLLVGATEARSDDSDGNDTVPREMK